MKKSNRIEAKRSSTRTRAQSKRRASAPRKKGQGNLPPVTNETPANADPVPPGELLTEWEDGPGRHEQLSSWEGVYFLSTNVREVWDGHAWQRYDDYCDAEPTATVFHQAMFDEPRRNRWVRSVRKVTRADALAWLGKHVGMTAIPEEFVEDFTPLSVVGKSGREDLREEFLCLARQALAASNNEGVLTPQRGLVMSSISVIAEALGFTELAQKAATVWNGTLAAQEADEELVELLKT